MIRPGSCLILALAVCLGCLKPGSSPPVVFHTLAPIQAPAPPAPRSTLAVEVMPVRLPEVLLRPQMVVARGSALELSETQRWGNPLDRDMQRVLAQNLALLLGSDAVVPSPYGERVAAAFRVDVDVQRWDARDGGELVLEAVWMVSPAAGGKALLVRHTSLREPVPGADADALAAAHSRVLGALSREIAEGLRACAGKGQP
ncbi:MAG: PqiC family protein [Holophaga sp.]|jgi:hypothetical protein